MKKKVVKISLILLSILLVVGGIGAYYVWVMVHGNEKLSGKQEAIPQKMMSVADIAKGEADWNCWQGPNFDKKSLEKAIKTDWSKGLTKKWEINFLCQGNQSATWSTSVIQGKVLLTTGRDEKNDLLFCLDAQTGALIWKGSYEVQTNTNHGPGARATPFIDKDKVYTYGRSGDLVCWNLLDGKILWHKKVAEVGGVEPDWGHSSSPFVFKDNVIVQTGGASLAVAYNKNTGEVVWKTGKGDAGYAPLNLLPADSSLLLFSGAELSGINPKNGETFWSLPWATDYKVNASLPLSEGNIVFVTSGYGKCSMAVEVNNGKAKKIWESKEIEGQHSDPVIVDGYIYGYAGNSSQNNGNLACLRLKDGKLMWKSKECGTGTLVYVDGYLICLDIKGNLYLIEAKPDKFTKKGEIKAAIPSVKYSAWTAPVVANGNLYLRYLQSLICFSIKDK